MTDSTARQEEMKNTGGKSALPLFRLFVLCGFFLGHLQNVWADEAALVTRGQYIFALAGGCGCHTADKGPTNAGGRPIETPYGQFYGTNITPDPVHGIGTWTDREIIDAIRLGVKPDGTVMSPVMPYPALSGMTDEDVTALVAFLRSQEPVAQEKSPPRGCHSVFRAGHARLALVVF